ncbi:MAG: hypothetical protein ACXWJC_12530 [Croceibacterium sp.]
MKPATIRRFDLFYLAWVALTVIDFLIRRDTYVSQIDDAASGSGAGNGFILGSTFVTVTFAVWTLVLLLLWYLVSQKRSTIAKWIVVLLVLLGIFSLPDFFRHAFAATEIVSLLGFITSVVAAYSLFGPGAKAWFAGETPLDPAATD